MSKVVDSKAKSRIEGRLGVRSVSNWMVMSDVEKADYMLDIFFNSVTVDGLTYQKTLDELNRAGMPYSKFICSTKHRGMFFDFCSVNHSVINPSRNVVFFSKKEDVKSDAMLVVIEDVRSPRDKKAQGIKRLFRTFPKFDSNGDVGLVKQDMEVSAPSDLYLRIQQLEQEVRMLSKQKVNTDVHKVSHTDRILSIIETQVNILEQVLAAEKSSGGRV